MGREDPQLKLRLTEAMKSKISQAARANGRSVNAEIVARLEAAEGGGSAEAVEWKTRFEAERASHRRLEASYEDARTLAMDYRDLMAQANRSYLQRLRTIESLCDIILSLDGKPGAEVIEFVQKLRTVSAEAAADFDRRPTLRESIEGEEP